MLYTVIYSCELYKLAFFDEQWKRFKKDWGAGKTKINSSLMLIMKVTMLSL